MTVRLFLLAGLGFLAGCQPDLNDVANTEDRSVLVDYAIESSNDEVARAAIRKISSTASFPDSILMFHNVFSNASSDGGKLAAMEILQENLSEMGDHYSHVLETVVENATTDAYRAAALAKYVRQNRDDRFSMELVLEIIPALSDIDGIGSLAIVESRLRSRPDMRLVREAAFSRISEIGSEEDLLALARSYRFDDQIMPFLSRIKNEKNLASYLIELEEDEYYGSVAVAAITRIKDEALINDIIRKALSTKVKRLGISRTNDQALLLVLREHSASKVALAADDRLRVLLDQIKKEDNEIILTNAARSAVWYRIRLEALKAANDPVLANQIVQSDENLEVRHQALKMIQNGNEIADVAANNDSAEIRIAAINRITDHELLFGILSKEADREVRRTGAHRIFGLKHQKYFADRYSVDYIKFSDPVITIQMYLLDPGIIAQYGLLNLTYDHDWDLTSYISTVEYETGGALRTQAVRIAIIDRDKEILHDAEFKSHAPNVWNFAKGDTLKPTIPVKQICERLVKGVAVENRKKMWASTLACEP